MANEINTAEEKTINNVIEFVNCKKCIFERKALQNHHHRCLPCIMKLEDKALDEALNIALEDVFPQMVLTEEHFLKAVMSPMGKMKSWMKEKWTRMLKRVR